MDPKEPKVLPPKALKAIKFGVQTNNEIYIHVSMIDRLPPRVKNLVIESLRPVAKANVVCLDKRGKRITFITYPTFDTEAHPSPEKSTYLDLASGRMVTIDSTRVDNLPVLTHKESLVSEEYPNYQKFKELTDVETKAGLFDDLPKTLLKNAWETRLSERGLKIRDHILEANDARV